MILIVLIVFVMKKHVSSNKSLVKNDFCCNKSVSGVDVGLPMMFVINTALNNNEKKPI